jgi:hypothetical protein
MLGDDDDGDEGVGVIDGPGGRSDRRATYRPAKASATPPATIAMTVRRFMTA